MDINHCMVINYFIGYAKRCKSVKGIIRIRMASAQYGRFVSLIAVTDDNEVSLRGFKYPVTDYSFDRFTSLGISNEIVDDHALIDIHRGKFIIIESKD